MHRVIEKIGIYDIIKAHKDFNLLKVEETSEVLHKNLDEIKYVDPIKESYLDIVKLKFKVLGLKWLAKKNSWKILKTQ